MIEEKTDEYVLKEAGEKYRSGEISSEQAAKQARVSVWTLIDYVERENLRPPKQGFEELEKEYDDLKKLGNV